MVCVSIRILHHPPRTTKLSSRVRWISPLSENKCLVHTKNFVIMYLFVVCTVTRSSLKEAPPIHMYVYIHII